MSHDPLIIEVPSGSAVARQLEAEPPASVAAGAALVTTGPTDAEGRLEAESGEVALSLPSPEALRREAEEVRRVLAEAGTGVEPLVVVIEAAEELRDDELAAVVDGALHAPRAVILRVVAPA